MGQCARQTCPVISTYFGKPRLDKSLTVLDACTAPGGKLAHLLSLIVKTFHVKHQNIAHVIALDNDEKRLQRVSQNLERLQLNQENVQLVCEDATTFQADTHLM